MPKFSSNDDTWAPEIGIRDRSLFMAWGAPKRNILSAKYFNDPAVKKEIFFATHPRQSLKNGGPTLTRILLH